MRQSFAVSISRAIVKPHANYGSLIAHEESRSSQEKAVQELFDESQEYLEDCDYEDEQDALDWESEPSSYDSNSSFSSCSSDADEDDTRLRSRPPARRTSLFEDQDVLFDSYDRHTARPSPWIETSNKQSTQSTSPKKVYSFSDTASSHPLGLPPQDAPIELTVFPKIVPMSPKKRPISLVAPSLLTRSLQYFSFLEAPSPPKSSSPPTSASAQIKATEVEAETEATSMSVMLQTFNRSPRVPPSRPVMNSAQYRMQAAERRMMRKGMISAPLKQRVYTWRKSQRMRAPSKLRSSL